MKRKILFTILTVVLIVLCGLSFSGCSEENAPVESIVVTKLPKLEYYRGDTFDIGSAEITVYYENGKSKVVPLSLSMISEYDADYIGEQILTIKYDDNTAYIKVNVAETPIYKIEVVEGDYKDEYVQDQILDLNNLKIRATYSNGFSEVIDVTASMVSGFDSLTIGEKQLVITYKGKSVNHNIKVVRKSISKVSLEAPAKINYVVGDTVDFTGGKFFIAYNNNTQEYINISDILDNPKFSVKIDGVSTNVFAQAGLLRYVYVYYENYECLYGVTVSELKAKKIELVTHPISPVVSFATVNIGGGYINIAYSDGTTRTVAASPANLSDYWRLYDIVDMSAGSIKISYNNNTSEIISADDSRLQILWKEFDNTKLGVYEITFVFEELQLNYDIEVIDARESEIIVYRPDTNIYQDSGNIDITAWEYAIKLTNGRYRAFDSVGSIKTNIPLSMLKSGTNPDFSTSTPGSRTYVLEYRSMDNSIVLQKEINFEVVAKEISSVAEFTTPTVKVFCVGDIVDITGGKIKLNYNDGSITNWIDVTSDMLVLDSSLLTDAEAESVEVELVFTDNYYQSEITFSYQISVVRKATQIEFMQASSVGLKQNYILGEEFESENLVVRVTFENGVQTTIIDFSGVEWAFSDTQFNQVGNFNVKLYYGDINNSVLFVNIPVTVTNNIVSITKDNGFNNLGQVLEGLNLSIGENAYLVATRQNGDEERIKVLSAMTNYNKSDNTLGFREVVITYESFTVLTTVEVLPRSLTQFSITQNPDKVNYIYTDAALSYVGMKLYFAFDNNTSATINGQAISSIIGEDSDEINTVYSLTIGRNNYKLSVTNLNTDLDGNRYLEQEITVAVLSMDNTLLLSDTFEVICFEKLITSINFELTDSAEQSFTLKEGEELAFPSNAVINVIYADSTAETVSLSSLLINTDYTASGYNKNIAGSQTVTITYLFSTCTFTVKTRAKILESIIVNPLQINIIEGMPISSDDVSIKLHFVDADNIEFSTPMYINVELNSVNSTYNKNDVVNFYLQDEQGHWYYEAVYDFSYTYTYYNISTTQTESITKTAEVLIRINRKSMTSISMCTFPKQIYIEDIEGEPSSTLDLTNGSVLITYNNGTNLQIDLANANLTILNNEFDTSEINNGSEKNQKITISYTENNITMTTYYYIVVKDRRYLTVDYQDNPTNNTYLFEYGTGESARPNFYLNGYLVYNGLRTVLADNSDIDEIEGFSLYYIDSDSNVSEEWPKNVGVYTLAIEFDGNAVNNPFIDTSRKIEIYPKSIVVRAVGRDITYGQKYYDENTVYSWYVQGYHRNGSVITYTDNPLLYGETQDMVAEITFGITTKSLQNISFFQGNDVDGDFTVVSATIGTYNLNPVLVTKLSNNYKIEEYKAADLVILPKPIKIVALDAEKVYGEIDPLFEYAVYDEENNYIGGNESGPSSIWLGGYEVGYCDAIPGYTLGRRQTDTNNVDDTHEILAGSASQIINYNIIAYTKAYLDITPKPVTIAAPNVEKSFGSATPDIVYHLKNGFSMAYGESFGDVFNDYVLKTGSEYYVEIYDINDTERFDNLSEFFEDSDPIAPVGQYIVYLDIWDISNYDVTVEPVIITVVPTQVDVIVDCITVSFEQREIDTVLDTVHNDRHILDLDISEYSLQFQSDFIFDDIYGEDFKEDLGLEFAKASGKNVGKYQIYLSSDSIAEYTDYFIFNVVGNYQEYYADFISTYYPDGASGIPTDAGEDGDKAYFVILPVSMEADVDTDGEIYSRKTSLRLDTDYLVNSTALVDANIISNLESALGFNFVNKTSTRANLGYYTADDYYGGYTYNYFANLDSRNYLCSGTLPENAQREIYNYILNGVVGSFVISHSFDYTIYPVELSVDCLSVDASYNGTTFNLIFSEYSLVSPSDTLSIVTQIKVVYNETINEVIATKLQEAGHYSIRLLGVSNYNYVLSEVSLGKVRNVTISPIELKILIGSPETKLVRQYNGKTIQPIDNNWVDAKGENDEIGYFRTTTYKIVNDVLQAAPKAISIYPVDPETMNYPRNAGVYDLVVRINSTYKNLNVAFVELNPEWTEGDPIANKYIPTEYDFTITKKTIAVYNWDKCNKKTYDKLPPAVSNLNQLIINNMAPGDVITANDLVFTFSRDMDSVPTALNGIVDSGDNTSAGYFDVQISIKQTNSNWKNYDFNIEGDEDYYLINRVSVPVTLNTSNSSLSKQYDKVAPSGVLSDLSVGQAIIYDTVDFDIIIEYYYQNGAWVNWSGNTVFDVGIYAYNLKPKYWDGQQYKYFENELGNPIYDETYTSSKILSWNYCYYISPQLGLDTNNCDGTYEIKKKDVSIKMVNAKEEVFDFGGGNSALRYVYSHTYNNQTISLASALSEVNGLFVMVDKNGDNLDLDYYTDFAKLNMTGSGTSVRNAGDYLELSFANMVAANPNYNITNKPIIYAVKKLSVDLFLQFRNIDNSGLPSMTYGDAAFVNGSIYFELSFASLSEFNAATGYSYEDIFDFISGDSGDYSSDKLIYSAAFFRLGSYYTSVQGSLFSSRPYTILNAGTYTPSVDNLTAMNYQINITGISFVVNPKEISINGVYRDYFSSEMMVDYHIEGGSINNQVEQSIVSSWIFVDNTLVNADASDFVTNLDYYAYILKTNMVTNDNNYVLTVNECEGLSNTNQAYYYLPLTVNKVNLQISLTNASGSPISVQYGHVLTPSEYRFVYGNLPPIDYNTTEYNPAAEATKQSEALEYIENEILNKQAIVDRIKNTSVGSYIISLYNYLKVGADLTALTNYSITFNTEVSYIINKIILNLDMINNAGSVYNANGYFSIIYDEANALTYNTASNQRLTYKFSIANPNSIIRPSGASVATLVEQMTYILGLTINGDGKVVYNSVPSIYENYADFVNNYISSNINYLITSQGGSPLYTAGECKIKLTDTWYNSQNYTLICNPANIVIYPKIKNIGSSTNEIPYSAVSLKGLPADYDTAIYNLSMYLQLNYNGFGEGVNVEWVDIYRNVIPDYYSDANYNRTWSVNVVGEQTIEVGKELRLTLTMTESFYNGLGAGIMPVVNSIESKEFLVRVYSSVGATVIDSSDSQIVKAIDNNVTYQYKEQIEGNFTYYISESDESVNSFVGKFDILSLKLKLNAMADSESYYTDLILFENATNKLVLKISGGLAGSYQIIMTDKFNNNIYYSDVLPSLDSVDLFDGMSHTLKIYIDKIGYNTFIGQENLESSIVITSERYYKIMWAIDDAFSCSLDYLGGITTETISVNPGTGLLQSIFSYDKYIDFDNDGYFGLTLNNAKVTLISMSADTMSVKLTNDGYISDFILWPSAFSGNYSYYITDDSELNTDTILETISFNSGFGYNNIYIESSVISDKTGETVTGEMSTGTYLVTYKTFYRLSSTILQLMETRTIRLVVCSSYYRRVGFDSLYVPNYSKPVTYESAQGQYLYSDLLGAYSYSKYVFDYDNIDPDNHSTATIMLKTNENRTMNIQHYDENYPLYRGLALTIAYDKDTQTYTTDLYMRIGQGYWTESFAGIDWSGSRNILEARYSVSTGVIMLTLYRGGVLLFSYTLKNGIILGLSAGNIKTIAEMSGYTAMNLYNVTLKMYAMELDSKTDTNLDMKDSVISVNTVLIDGDNAPVSTHNRNTFFSFKATGTEFKFIFANTVGTIPTISGTTMINDYTGKRGLYLRFTQTAISLGIYKYNLEFIAQTLKNVNLLDGARHDISIELTKEILPEANILSTWYKQIECYKVIITIDRIAYIMPYPAWNDLDLIPSGGSPGRDREREETANFLNDYRFLAIVPISATIEISDMILY